MIRNKNSKLLDIALGELGISEIKGSKHNPRIVEYHSITTLHATTDEVPWCSSFVNWCVSQLGIEPTRSAMAASWRYWGNRLSKPKKGCIIGYVKPDGSGHVGIFLKETNGLYTILGGNQADSVKVSSYKIKGRKWFFTEPKVFINSKTARSGGAAAITSSTALGGGLLDSISSLSSQTKQIKQGVAEISENTGIGNTVPAFQIAAPWVVLALSIYIIYDRLNKEKLKNVE